MAEDEVDLLWGVYAADRALVTAWIDEDDRQHFAVPLGDPGVKSAAEQAWVARGLQQITSTALDFHEVPADAVGEPGWYLQRQGFAWGGTGVAAVWYGVARRLLAQAEVRPLDQIGQVVRRAAEEVLLRTQHALGPGPQVSEPDHAARIADLELCLCQEQAERDQAALGRWLLDALPEVGW